MTWRLRAVVLVLVLGGCSGVTTNPAPTDTVTPAPIPTAETESVEATLPPGVTGNHIVDADALVDAHQQRLQNQSYTVRVRIESDGERAQRLLRLESPTRYYWRDNATDSTRSVTAFADGSQLHVRTNRSGYVTDSRGNVTGRPSTPAIRLARPFLRVNNVTVSTVLVESTRHYEIRGQYGVHPTVEAFRNYSVRAVVSPDGLIRSLEATYTTTRGDEPTTVTYRFEYTAIGTTTVTRPSWVDSQ